MSFEIFPLGGGNSVLCQKTKNYYFFALDPEASFKKKKR